MAPSSTRSGTDEPVRVTSFTEDVHDDTSVSLERLRVVQARLRTPAASVTFSPRVVPVAPLRPVAGDAVRVWVVAFLFGLGLSSVAALGSTGGTRAHPVSAGAGIEARIADGFARVDVAPEEAVRRFRETVAAAPDDVRAASGLGVALAGAGQIEEAVPWLCRGVRAPGAVGAAAADALARAGRVCR
jgi:hypothetical protein